MKYPVASAHLKAVVLDEASTEFRTIFCLAKTTLLVFPILGLGLYSNFSVF